MNNLPINQIVPQLLAALDRTNTVILNAPPGSGKSTELPAAIYESGLIKGKILLLQPRRMAARALAGRLAWRLNCELGGLVGFSVRHQSLVSPKTAIEVLTEGLLTRRLLDNPFLEDTGLVILDEFHERSAESDLALAAIREAQEISDLKVIVMSATLDNTIQEYLAGAENITLDYQPYPLDITYLPQETGLPLEKKVYNGLKNLLATEEKAEGDILVFLPGQKEIEVTAAFLKQSQFGSAFVIQKLYGALPLKEQDAVLNIDLLPPERRLILATNIAETSLTIPRIRAVIDCGLQKSSRFDPYSGLDRLVLGRASLSAVTQRSGRAARLGPGRAVRLWSKLDERSFAPHEMPQILSSDPAPHLLWMQTMQPGWFAHFPFINPPADMGRWQEAAEFLSENGLLDKSCTHVTKLGQAISRYPLPPLLGLILERGKELNLLFTAATITAILSGRPLITRHDNDNNSGDFEEQLYLLFSWEKAGVALNSASKFNLNAQVLAEFLLVRKQLLALAAAPYKPNYEVDQIKERLLKLLLPAYLEHIAIQSSTAANDYTMASGHGLHLEQNAQLCPQFLLVLAARAGDYHRHNRALIDLYLPLSFQEIATYCPSAIIQEEGAFFDEESLSVKSCRRTRLGKIELARQTGGKLTTEAAAAALTAAMQNHPLATFAPAEDLEQFKLRLAAAARFLPDNDWPEYDTLLSQALNSAATMANSFKAIKELNWEKLLSDQLSWAQKSLLDKEVPSSLKLPRGMAVKIDYSCGQYEEISAAISAHIQEFYGLKVHPQICRGRINLKLILLAPNNRPAQITGDIVTFWKESYPAVRKDLFGRYPKHNWPEDPLNSQACGLGKRYKEKT